MVENDETKDVCTHEGCWVEIFEDEDFSTDDAHTKIIGPAEYSNLKNINNKDWGDQIDSLIVGPYAHVQAWEDEDYKDTMIEFGPDTRHSNLNELNFGDDIDSIKIRCTKCNATTR